LLDARASLFQNLTKLAMTHIRFPSFDFLIRFISGFPVLKELSLHNIMWEAPKCPLSPLPSPSTTNVQASPLLPSRLQTLNIFSSSNSPILYWVLTSGRLHAATDHEQVVPALRKLVLSDILPTESHLVGSLLRTVGPSLQHLELGFLTHNASPHAIQGLHILTHTSSMTHMYMYWSRVILQTHSVQSTSLITRTSVLSTYTNSFFINFLLLHLHHPRPPLRQLRICHTYGSRPSSPISIPPTYQKSRSTCGWVWNRSLIWLIGPGWLRFLWTLILRGCAGLDSRCAVWEETGMRLKVGSGDVCGNAKGKNYMWGLQTRNA